jgi:hypothetical protein
MSLHAGEISLASGGRLDILSRTAFGFDLDHPTRYGLKQELANFKLTLNLLPYQQLSNRVNSKDAVGFIDLTFFNLDFEFNPGNKPGSGSGGYNNPGTASTNRFQTGAFVAGIVSGDWVIQMNAGGNEPFWSPWNKSFAYVNDAIKFSWASLDSMVDVKRITKVSELAPQDAVVKQFQQDASGLTDTLGADIGGSMIGVMYNAEDVFGLHLKLASQYSYDSPTVAEGNLNGFGAGVDFVVTPTADKRLKITGSAAGSRDYGEDSVPDPVYGGARVGYGIPLNEDITLEPFAGSDIGTKIRADGSPEALGYEIAGGLTMRWPGQGGWYTDYILNADGRVFPGMSASWKMLGSSDKSVAESRQDCKFTLFEPRGDEGVFYGLGSEIVVDVNNVTADAREFLATVYLDYEIAGAMKGPGILVPWTTVCYDNVPGTGSDRVNGCKVDCGVKLQKAITNTALGLTWNSGDLLTPAAKYRFGYIKASVEITY